MKSSLRIKSARLILMLIIPVVLVASLVLGTFSLWSERHNLIGEINKRYRLSVANYRNLLDESGSWNIDDIVRAAALGENVVFAAVTSWDPSSDTISSDDDDFAFHMGTADGGFNKLDTGDLAKLSERPEKFLKNYLIQDIYPKELLRKMERDRNRGVPLFLTEEEFNKNIPALVDNRMQVYFQQNNTIEENELTRIYPLFRHCYQKTEKGFRLEQCSDTEKNDLYNFLLLAGFLETQTSIFPHFRSLKMEKSYLFYSPLFVFDSSSGRKECCGNIIICYSFQDVVRLLHRQSVIFILIVFVFTVIAIIWSIFMAFTFSSSIITPLQKMCSQVEIISRTEDFETLKGTPYEKLKIQSGDEIEALALDINQMTRNLIEKSKSDKQLLLGKEIQKKFIPLAPMESEHVDIYGFYEGAKGVSGDYFDYKELDSNHYAFIICDVAGKGVPAALIMVQISTLFHLICNGATKINTAHVVQCINDTLAEKGFAGRFASIMVLLLDVSNGETRLTSAGYSELLVYHHVSGKCQWLKIPENGAAAGVFPSSQLPEPYREQKFFLKNEDMILLFSDGIEESRNGEFSIDEHGCRHFEEFGKERLTHAIEKAPVKTPEGIIRHLIEQEQKFRNGTEQYDDLTILGIMRK